MPPDFYWNPGMYCSGRFQPSLARETIRERRARNGK